MKLDHWIVLYMPFYDFKKLSKLTIVSSQYLLQLVYEMKLFCELDVLGDLQLKVSEIWMGTVLGNIRSMPGNLYQ